MCDFCQNHISQPENNSSLSLHHFKIWMLFVFIAIFCFILFWETIGLGFTAEDYWRINVQKERFDHSLWGPLSTPPALSTRYRPVQFYSFALQSELFRTNIWMYRVSTLLFLTIQGSLFFTLIWRTMGARPLPALVAAVFSVSHFSKVDVTYFYSAHHFIFSDIILILLLSSLFANKANGLDSQNMLYTSFLFLIGLLTNASILIIVPLVFYYNFLHTNNVTGNRLKRAVRYSVAFSVPFAAVLAIEAIRCPVIIGGLFSPIQMAKNLIVATSHIFYNFKPFGFSDTFSSQGFVPQQWIRFVLSHPSLLVMLCSSAFLIMAILVTFRFGNQLTKFLCLGLALNTLFFMPYVGVSPRYLSFSILFASGLGALVYSYCVKASKWQIGFLIFLVLFAWNLHVFYLEKSFWLEKIFFAEKIKQFLILNKDFQGEIFDDGIDLVKNLRVFWQI